MGSKAKYAKYIVPILQKAIDENNIKTYIEPFVGGANVIDKIKCENRIGYDRSETLVALLNCMKNGEFNSLLTDCTKEQWDEAKSYVKDGIVSNNLTLPQIGGIEFFGSFSNGGFPRGFAKPSQGRNYYQEAYRNAKEQADKLKDITFMQKTFQEVDSNSLSNAVIYCDPPYYGTKQYGYAKDNWKEQDFIDFWNWVRELSKNNFVFVSEQSAPDDFKAIWEMECHRTVGKDNKFKATEKLFVIDK